MLDGSIMDVSAIAVLPSSTLLPSIGEGQSFIKQMLKHLFDQMVKIKNIFLGLIEWAVSARYNQRVRAHLYGALLNFLQMQPDFYGKLYRIFI